MDTETRSSSTPSLRGGPLVSWAGARNVQDVHVQTLAFALMSIPHTTITPQHALSSREAASAPPTVHTARAQDAYHCVFGSAVVPFECNDILTCLDGFENPPTFAQCESPPNQLQPAPRKPPSNLAYPSLLARASALCAWREAER